MFIAPSASARFVPLASAVLAGLLSGSCSGLGAPDPLAAPGPGVQRPEAVGAPASGRIAALINGEPITWASLDPSMAELAGSAALRERALDQMLRAELGRRGLSITQADIQAERALLDQTQPIGADPAAAAALTDIVRARRGLGPQRFDALLRRSAGLRRLVEGQAEVTEAEVALAHRIRHGPQHVLRLIAAPSPQEAARLRDLVASGDLDAFIRVAAESSVDASAPRGGLLGSISLDDPAYPTAIRDAARGLVPGQVSPIVAAAGLFVILRLDDIRPPDPTPLESVAPALRAELGRRKARVAMDRLAAELLARAEVTILDPSLEWAWSNAPSANP